MNRLAKEKSPYLLQHADNPVDWYPWGDEAFGRAEAEDKPVLLSIGYSTCHWCHVMERECFEDPEVAALLNQGFVSIKVDREERPDLDDLYMTACQLLTGQGGWPLSVFLTPDRKPFHAATYIPRQGRWGLPGMLELLPRLSELWKTRRGDLTGSADRVARALQQAGAVPRGERRAQREGEPLGQHAMRRCFEELAGRFDAEHGGFGDAPKFPNPQNFFFLLRYWKRTGEPRALEMVEKSLQAMRGGGIFDQLGFGFHRYSTDAEWLVPHFEKMLYDQAMLALAYTEAYQATGKELYARTAREILTYALRDMTSPEGALYSAEDADSEGLEGAYYLWSYEQLSSLLEPAELEACCRIFHVREYGNFIDEATRMRNGKNILHIALEADDASIELREKLRQKLLRQRETRVRPFRDDKILAGWNGLMIAALARAAAVFEEASYAQAAERAAEFVLQKLHAPGSSSSTAGRLLHSYRDGPSGTPAFAEDYAYLVWGLIELYEATFKPRYLARAKELMEELIRLCWADREGGFFLAASDAENLLARQRPSADGALPSANSVGLLDLLRLARLTGSVDYEAKAEQLMRLFSTPAQEHSSFYTFFLAAADFAIVPSFEVVLAGDPDGQDMQAMTRAIRRRFLPSKVLLLRPENSEEPEIIALAPFTRSQRSLHGQATAYVCRNFSCQLPTTDLQTLLTQLEAPSGSEKNAVQIAPADIE